MDANQNNNRKAFIALMQYADGNLSADYVIEKATRYLEGQDNHNWKWGLHPQLYRQAGLPLESLQGADE